MTTIAFRAGIIAADSMVFQNAQRANFEVRKIRKFGQTLVSGYGVLVVVQSFIRWAETVKHWDDLRDLPDFPNNDSGGGIAIRQDNGGFLVAEFNHYGKEEYWITEAGFLAWGSGANWAEGALWAGASAEEAVRAAQFYSTTSGGTIHTEQL